MRPNTYAKLVYQAHTVRSVVVSFAVGGAPSFAQVCCR